MDVRCEHVGRVCAVGTWLLRIRSIFDRFDKDSICECLVEIKVLVSVSALSGFRFESGGASTFQGGLCSGFGGCREGPWAAMGRVSAWC